MADRSFNDLRGRGLIAYADFYDLVTDRKAIADWRSRVQPNQLPAIADFTLSASSLPTPAEGLAFSAIANVAHHAASGVLKSYTELVVASGRHDANRLVDWRTASVEAINLLAPEAASQDTMWLEARGRFSIETLVTRARQFGQAASEHGDVGLLAVFVVLLRDWASDVEPTLEKLGFSIDTWLWDAASLAPTEDVPEDPFPTFTSQVETTFSYPTAGSVLTILADTEPLRRLAFPTQSEVLAARDQVLREAPPAAPGRDEPDADLGHVDPALRPAEPGADEEDAPVVEEEAPAIEEEAPAIEEEAPAVEEEAPGEIDAGSNAAADQEPTTSHDEPSGARVSASEAPRPSTTVSSDLSTDQDQLEYALYADAIAKFIRDDHTRAPLTIGIKAPWGAGKTSLMRMIRKELDPDALFEPPEVGDAPRLKVRELLRETRGKSPEQAAAALEPDDVSFDARRTTIWFNAWKYQSGEQLWAGLAHAILNQVSGRMTPLERDRLWASIQLRRVSHDEVRRRIYKHVVVRLVPFAIALLVAAAVVLFLGLVKPSWVPGATLLSGVPIIAAGVVQGIRSGWEEVSKATPELVQAPDYESRLGFLHLVDTDMRRILEVAGATETRPFVVFIDDLDRCSYTTVAQVIEALNVFLAGDYRNCIFVIAMEPDLVAAQIHVAYERLFKQLQDEHGDLGWRFLEKMVQLPLALPQPQDLQVERFLDSILAVETEAEIADIDEDSPEVAQAREEIRDVQTTPGLAGIRPAFEQVRARYQDKGARGEAVVQKAARLEFADRFDDGAAREMLRTYAKDLSGNPREIKRFVNVFRFYAYIDFWRGTQRLETPGLEGAAKLARLAIGWPSLLSALSADVDLPGRRASLLQLLEEADDDHWEEVVARAPARAQSALRTAQFREVVRREPRVGAVAASFF